MNFLTRRPRFRIISISAASLLCILMVSVIAQKGSSNELLKKKPSVVLQASITSITLPCPAGGHSRSGSCPATANSQVVLTATAKDFHSQPLYAYTVTGGRITGEGGQVTWDLSGVAPDTYTATVTVQYDKKHRVQSSVTVKVMTCPDCTPDLVCPAVSVTCPDSVNQGETAEFKAALDPTYGLASYRWTVEEGLSGRISSGQETTTITVRTNGLGGRTITATVKVSDTDSACGTITRSCSTAIKP
jgi:hypothetical protein